MAEEIKEVKAELKSFNDFGLAEKIGSLAKTNKELATKLEESERVKAKAIEALLEQKNEIKELRKQMTDYDSKMNAIKKAIKETLANEIDT